MNAEYRCPKCKTFLTATPEGYSCQNCNCVYFLRDGYVDFIGESEFYAGEVSKKQMEILIQEIDSLGYEEGISRFFKQNPSLQDYVTSVRRIDWVCHCLTKNNSRCLDIGSGLGNISENLSRIYGEVYSLEAVKERIEFQKRRYKNSNRANIIILRGNALELPFPDNYFDLIVCNGVLEWVGMMNTNVSPREVQLSFLREVKRVLSNNGCLYVGIENRLGLPFLLGERDHSGLPYTSLLPRWLANFVVKKFGRAGGVYGDKSSVIREKRGYHTYTYTIYGYKKLFAQAGFGLKSYWVFPSYNEPYFSGNLEDKIGLKAFVRYQGDFVKRFKILVSIIKKMPKSVIRLTANLLSPSFLFYCFKSNSPDSVDEIIVSNAAIQSFTTISQGSDIKYVLYDKRGKPARIAHLKRFGNDFPTVLRSYDKTSPNSHIPKERIWLEDWISGRPLAYLKSDEIAAAINWLVDFQDKTRGPSITTNDITSEVNYIKIELMKIPDLNKLEYVRWIEDYQQFMEGLRISKVAEHGDFWQGNILIDKSVNKINVIDWDHYREDGNPFFDFIFFIINVILLGGSVEEFGHYLDEGRRVASIVKKMKAKVESYFGFELNLDILIRYVIIRFIIRKHLEGGSYDQTTITLKKVLNILSQDGQAAGFGT
ncbi:MAG: hypothetical protein AUG16_00770 [Thaumarchaeota archaeon 13_1_20CM_2_39_20]|nr:MAG: hypothetical protein AUI59_00930 [Thaumarchaeota archaeon 13_1_40CM_2_39_13_1]OLE41207.1 MAG: hypothetical protein AUG16_00770 [Thaumarchaeota archaeon 13_1_20CM_2_39_20]